MFVVPSWFQEGPHHLLEPLPANPRYVQMGGGALLIKNVQLTDIGSYR